MPFIAYIDETNPSLEKSAKLLFPISLGQKYHTGERLKALIDLAKKYNSTILIADALHRHNFQDEKKALALGDKFLEKQAKLFKEMVLIDSIEDWKKHKEDASVVKLIRWRTWGEIKNTELEKASCLIEESCQKLNSSLVKKMNETAERNLSKLNLQSSINYQKEENAYLLTFSDFDYHCYPGPLNASQAETVRLFSQQYKIPLHKSIKFDPVLSSVEVISYKQQNHAQSLPIVLRLLAENIETTLKSSEISEQHKKLFIAKINSIFISIEHGNGIIKNGSLTPVVQPKSNELTFFTTYQSEPVESNHDAVILPSLTRPESSI